MLNLITFIYFEDYIMINDIKLNIISLMNLFRSLMNYTLFKLVKTTD